MLKDTEFSLSVCWIITPEALGDTWLVFSMPGLRIKDQKELDIEVVWSGVKLKTDRNVC